MKYVCTICHRSSPDGNLWCQEPDCPAEEKPAVFGYGQHLGDIKVIRLLRLLRTSAMYEGERKGEPVLLKVAHQNCENQLRREAETLRQLQGGAKGKRVHPALPTLLPAYSASTTDRHSYGKTIVEGQTFYYEVFAYIDGVFLRDFLLENPQPWYETVVWIVISLGEVVQFLHQTLGRLHVFLSPEIVLLRTDLDGIVRPILMDLGLLIQDTQVEHLHWLHYYGLPAYVPPELTYSTPDAVDNTQQATAASDVYGIAVILYEMLAGHPLHEFTLQRDNEIREAVRNHKPPALMRRDLPDRVHSVIEQAISKNMQERYQDMGAFLHDLRLLFGSVPSEKKRTSSDQRLLIAVTIGAIALTGLILLAAWLG